MQAYDRVKKDVSGFSFLELIAIICVLGILAAIAIPVFSTWMPDYRLKTAARDLYSNLQRAKMGAIKNNSEWRVYFDDSVTPGRYFLCSDSGGDGWDTPTTLGGNDVVEMTINLSNYDGVNYGNGNATVDINDDNFGGDFIRFTSDPWANFTARATVNSTGYAYLSNGKGTCYGVGTPSPSGVIVLRKWTGASWQ